MVANHFLCPSWYNLCPWLFKSSLITLQRRDDEDINKGGYNNIVKYPSQQWPIFLINHAAVQMLNTVIYLKIRKICVQPSTEVLSLHPKRDNIIRTCTFQSESFAMNFLSFIQRVVTVPPPPASITISSVVKRRCTRTLPNISGTFVSLQESKIPNPFLLTSSCPTLCHNQIITPQSHHC